MDLNRENRRLPLWLLILLQLVLTGLVLCVFAVFHHVIPYAQRRNQPMPAPIATVAHAETEKAEEPAPLPEPTTEPEPTPEPEATPEPLPPTWAELFAEQLSDEAVWEENSYRSPTMAVTVTKYEYTEVCPDSVYFVADIYLTQIEQLRSVFPLAGTFALPTAVARDHDAVIAINSDVFVNQRSGFVVRDGELYNQNPTTADICVLYKDGRLCTYGPGEYAAEEIVAGEPWQIWHFGPALLNQDGSVKEQFNISSLLQAAHPRTAIGYYEPGHYCFVVVDGRQGSYSRGVTTQTLAAIMQDLGCAAAYNLDGGASSVMIFNGKLVNKPCGDRNLNDLIAIVEQTEEEAGE